MIVNGQLSIGEDGIVCPMPGQVSRCDGVLFGFTLPYNKPWNIKPIKAANEPAKPPLPTNGDFFTKYFSDEAMLESFEIPEGE